MKQPFLLLLFLTITCFSQQGSIDKNFNVLDDGSIGDGFDNYVRTISVQTDGKLIVGGDYNTLNGKPTAFLCRLFDNGNKDVSFNLGKGSNNKIYTTNVLADGKIIVGGSFTSFDGKTVGRLVRLNSNGSLDSSFSPLTGATNNIIYDIDYQKDGKYIAVGSFTYYDRVNTNRVVRILSNGKIDPSFNIGTGASHLVEKVRIQPDGKIILTGSFTNFNEQRYNGIVRLNSDGTIDDTFTTGIGFDSSASVSAIEIQPDGKILLGGNFTNYNNVACNRIIRLNSDGTIDDTFLYGTGFSNGYVYSIKLDSNNNILIGGSFSGNYNGVKASRFVRLLNNGMLDDTLDVGEGFSSGVVYAINTFGEAYYLGGTFTVFDGQNQGRLAKIDINEGVDPGFLTAGVGFNNSVFKVLALPDNKIMALGNFSSFNDEKTVRIARLLENGTIDKSFDSTNIGSNHTIRSGLMQPDGKIIIMGNFTNYNGTSTNRIARILPNGDLDGSFLTNTGCNNNVYDAAIQPDGKIIIVGNFSSYAGTSNIKIARLLNDGRLDTSFNTGTGAQDGIIQTVIIQPDGKIILGGNFTVFNQKNCNRIVRLNNDGSIDHEFNTGQGFDKTVYSIALQPDGKIIVGGAFLNFNGISNKRLVRLNSDGSLDSNFITGTGFSNGDVRTILIQPDQRLIVGGSFSGNYNSQNVKRILRLLSNGTIDDSFVTTLNGTLYSCVFTSKNDLVLGGNFNSVSGKAKHRIVRLKLCINSSVWNGTLWSNGLPSEDKALTFEAPYVINTNTEGCLCNINKDVEVTVKENNTLKIQLNYSGNGTMILENSASLYQTTDDIVNTGKIKIKRQSAPMFLKDYTYWSSPVEEQKILDISPLSAPYFYSYDVVSEKWQKENPSNLMKVGKGYIIRSPNNFSLTNSSIYEANFFGIPNNGEIKVETVANGNFNLIGNPYPSAINADLFLNYNQDVVEGTIYFWTHNTQIKNGKYASSDYALYNKTGSTSAVYSKNKDANQIMPNENIALGQSFFIKTKNTSKSIIFNNNMRAFNNNALFFKNDITQNKHRIWLNLTSKEGAFKQILIGYVNGASNEYNDFFDGENFNGNDFINFYSYKASKKLTIQGRAIPVEINDTISLGYSSKISGEFSISIDKIDGSLAHKNVFIKDKETNTFHNLKEKDYSFVTNLGTFDNRFSIYYEKPNDYENLKNKTNYLEDSVSIFIENKKMKIVSAHQNITEVSVYDVSGKLIYKNDKLLCDTFFMPTELLFNKVYFTQVKLKNNKYVVKKILLDK